jgi:hypothetical protein
MEPFRDRANLQNPQTLNLYSYVQNNPLSRRDATGHYSCASDTVSTNANGDTVVTAGACHFDLSDLPQIAVAVGHHFLPQKMLRIPADRLQQESAACCWASLLALLCLPAWHLSSVSGRAPHRLPGARFLALAGSAALALPCRSLLPRSPSATATYWIWRRLEPWRPFTASLAVLPNLIRWRVGRRSCVGIAPGRLGEARPAVSSEREFHLYGLSGRRARIR